MNRTAIVAVLAGVVASTLWCSPVSAAETGDLQPILADLPTAVGPSSDPTDIVLGGHRVSAIPIDVRVDAPAAHAASDTASTTVLAYSMDLEDKPASATTQWTATSPATPGIHGVRSSNWIARQAGPIPADTAHALPEMAARQIAIWSYTNGFSVTPQSVPDSSVRARALTLIRDAANAPSNVAGSPTSLSIAAKISDVETDTVAFTILLSTNGENSFCGAQKLDVRLYGAYGVVKTGQVSSLQRSGAGRYKSTVTGTLPGQPCSGKNAPAIDFDSARFTFARPTQGSTLEVDWNLTLDGLSIFRASDGSAPLIIAEAPNLEFRELVAIDPSTFPTADTYLQRFLTSLLRSFHGIFAIVVLILLLYITPWVKQGIDAALTGAGRAAKRRFNQYRAADDAPRERRVSKRR